MILRMDICLGNTYEYRDKNRYDAHGIMNMQVIDLESDDQ